MKNTREDGRELRVCPICGSSVLDEGFEPVGGTCDTCGWTYDSAVVEVLNGYIYPSAFDTTLHERLSLYDYYKARYDESEN